CLALALAASAARSVRLPGFGAPKQPASSTQAGAAAPPGLRRRFLSINEGCGEEWNHQLVVTDERVALSDAGGRPADHVGLRSVQAHEIQVDGGEAVERNPAISHESDSLE